MHIAPETQAAMRPSLESYRKVSAERIRDEWLKALKAKKPSRAFEVMRDEGLLEVSAPELFALSELRVEGLDVDVLTHSLLTVDALPADAELRLAGLFHALGVTESGEPRPVESSRMARELGMRLRLSNAERERVTALVRHQTVPEMVPEGGALRRYLRDVTPELLPDVLRLLRAHATAGQSETAEDVALLEALEARCKEEMSRVPPLSLKELAVGGRDLIVEAGIMAGPEVGRTLNALLEIVLDDPAENTRDTLLARARALRSAP
jgi:tRNA nucleotidyltransferase (CCA-adding enzyme)